MTARETALVTLKKCLRSGQYSNIALDNALTKSDLKDSDRALAAALFYGVIEKKITLDFYISRLSSRPLDEIDEDIVTILRLGIYQLAFLDRIPDHAAINETVSLAPSKKRGFVNAVLRSYLREKEKIEFPADKTEYLSVKYSVCRELAEKFTSAYGYERAERILAGFSHAGGTTLRVNTVKTTVEELAEKLSAEKTRLSPYGLYVKGQISELYGFEEGFFYVQDEASQIAAASLGAREGETVIDVCSCPGSKTFGAAMDMKNTGKIYSFDLHANKLSLVISSAKRLGIDIIETEARDARKPREELIGKADRVICDVPCSGFGVLGKKPELRYKDPAVSGGLPSIQYDILTASSAYLKVGGTLVYSTCTVFSEENEDNVNKFLASHPDFSLVPFEVGKIKCESGMMTFLPDEYATDGFFVAKMVKNK